MKTSLSSGIKGLVHLIFPDLCMSCDQDTPVEDGIFCIKCLASLPFTHHEYEPENSFTKHFKSRFPIVSGGALFYLSRGSGIERMLHRLKYGNRPDIGYKLGMFYGGYLKEIERYSNLDAIIPVPLHLKKFVKRGYNQSEQFAKGIGKAIDVPVRTDLLKRIRFTQTQTKMSRSERIRNTSMAFGASEQLKEKAHRILLVDDVLTTGATFEGCIQAVLLQNSQTEIHLITIAMGHNL